MSEVGWLGWLRNFDQGAVGSRTIGVENFHIPASPSKMKGADSPQVLGNVQGPCGICLF